MTPSDLPLPPRDKVIAFDFDGVLATYDKGQYPALGEPIKPMVELLKVLLEEYECWVFTSRVNEENAEHRLQGGQIREWLQTHARVGFEHTPIRITDKKSPRIGLFLDDRAVRIAKNKGDLDYIDGANYSWRLGEVTAKNVPLLPKYTTVPEILRAAAGTYEERNALYGDNYRKIGEQLAALFPHGLCIEAPEEWNRLCVFIQAVGKLGRYARSLKAGGHQDSAHDASVYSAMLEELTNEEA